MSQSFRELFDIHLKLVVLLLVELNHLAILMVLLDEIGDLALIFGHKQFLGLDFLP
jgi:hypothetical protein